MKVLVTADLHIDDYQTYNPTKYFRLNQFQKLSNELVSICKDQNAQELWICGDLLRTPNPSTYVWFALRKFIMNFTEQNIRVRFCFGNHDLTIKNQDTSIDEYNKSTFLSIFNDIPNVYGYDSKVVDIESKKVYFCSWQPNNQIEYKDADYLVCHGDVDKQISPFCENLIDTTKYKRTLSGHIHIPKDTETFSSIGTPIPHNFGDYQETSVILFDTELNNIKRIPISDNYLKFEYVETLKDKEIKTLELEETKKDVVLKVKENKTKINELKIDEQIEVKDTLNINPRQILNLYCEDLTTDSKKVIDLVINECVNDEKELNVPNLYVEFKTLNVKNFLSIKDLNFNFEEYNGLTCIVGSNGSGKSTLFNALLFMLLGSLDGYSKSDFTAINKESFKGILTLRYNDHDYSIERTLSSLVFKEDNNILDTNNKRDLEKVIRDKLRFIDFLEILYVKQESKGIFASMTESNRISFLSKMIGLTLVNKWTESLANKIQDLKQDTDSYNIDKVKFITNIENLKTYNEENKDHNTLKDETLLKDQVTVISKEIKDLETEINSNGLSISKLRETISQNENKVQNFEISKNNLKSFDSEELKILKDLNDLNSKLEAHTIFDLNELTNNAQSINNLNVELNSIKESKYKELSVFNSTSEQYKRLRTQPNICPTCKQPIQIDPNEIERLKNAILISNNAIKTFDSQIAERESTIQSLNARNVELQSIQMNIETLKYNIQSQNTMLKSLKERKVKDLEIVNSIDVDSITKQNEQFKLEISDLDKENLKIKDNINALNTKINDLTYEIAQIEFNNKIYNKIQDNIKLIKDYEVKINEILEKIQNKIDICNELSKFNSKILSDKGMLVASLLSKVAEYLNTDELLKVETTTQLQNGSLKPSLNIKLFVKEFNTYVDYDKLSGGQRLQADLRFLNGITNTLGNISFMLLDETFKFFDQSVIVESSSIMKTMNVKQIFLILHGGHESAIADHIINATLDLKNGSIYTKIM